MRHSLSVLVHSIHCCTACPSCGCKGSLSLLDVSNHIVWLLSLQHCLMYIDWTNQTSCPNRCMTPPAHRSSNPLLQGCKCPPGGLSIGNSFLFSGLDTDFPVVLYCAKAVSI